MYLIIRLTTEFWQNRSVYCIRFLYYIAYFSDSNPSIGEQCKPIAGVRLFGKTVLFYEKVSDPIGRFGPEDGDGKSRKTEEEDFATGSARRFGLKRKYNAKEENIIGTHVKPSGLLVGLTVRVHHADCVRVGSSRANFRVLRPRVGTEWREFSSCFFPPFHVVCEGAHWVMPPSLLRANNICSVISFEHWKIDVYTTRVFSRVFFFCLPPTPSPIRTHPDISVIRFFALSRDIQTSTHRHDVPRDRTR